MLEPGGIIFGPFLFGPFLFGPIICGLASKEGFVCCIFWSGLLEPFDVDDSVSFAIGITTYPPYTWHINYSRWVALWMEMGYKAKVNVFLFFFFLLKAKVNVLIGGMFMSLMYCWVNS